MNVNDSFDDKIIAMRTAAAAPTDRLSIANAKDDAAREQLRALAVNYAAHQLVDIEREYERKAIIDEAKLKAAGELGCSVNELRLAEFTDEEPVSYAPPDSYAAAIKALQEQERAR